MIEEIIPIIISIVKIIFIILIIANLAIAIYPIKPKLRFTLFIWRRFNLKILLQSIFLIIITLTIALSLFLYLPFMRWGWLNLFISGGGNLLITPITEQTHSSNIFFRLLVPIFILLFILAIPSLAKMEEYSFRRGYIKWDEIIRQSIKFGLTHLIVGIPLGAAIALIFVGLFYGYEYRKTFFNHYKDYLEKNPRKKRNKENNLIIDNDYLFEIEEQAANVSTTYHTLYNTLLAIIILIFVILVQFV